VTPTLIILWLIFTSPGGDVRTLPQYTHQFTSAEECQKYADPLNKNGGTKLPYGGEVLTALCLPAGVTP